MRGYVKTIQDMEKLYYSKAGEEMINKVDAPVITTTTGVYNAVYGAQVWAQLNQEANFFGCVPKYPFLRSGWRVITARAGTLGGGGVAENGAVPDSVKPTFAEVSTKPKTVARVFNVSEVQSFLASNGDDAVGDLAFMRAYMGAQIQEDINTQLMGDADTVAGNNFESFDRVASANSEVALVNANDLDIYSLDRDAGATWADAYVSHNSGTDRVLTDDMIRALLSNTAEAGANTSFLMTGYDTEGRINGIYHQQTRYTPLGQSKISSSVNGIQTQTGVEAGLTVATVYGIPLLKSKSTVKDTISRVYAVDASNPEGYDRPRVGIAVAKPMEYFEAGMSSNKDPFGINALADEGMFRMMGELICTRFGVQGKIRDLL